MFTCSDMDLMRTAGMDSLMLNWQNTLGIQIFFPLTVVGLAVCESHPSPSKPEDPFKTCCSAMLLQAPAPLSAFAQVAVMPGSADDDCLRLALQCCPSIWQAIASLRSRSLPSKGPCLCARLHRHLQG